MLADYNAHSVLNAKKRFQAAVKESNVRHVFRRQGPKWGCDL